MKKIILILIPITIFIFALSYYYLNLKSSDDINIQNESLDKSVNINPDKIITKDKVSEESKKNASTDSVKLEVKADSSVLDKKTFTSQEIAKHNSKEDCWMSIEARVLDVTTFVSRHPGGNAILKGCGKDATSYFNGISSHLKPVVIKLLDKYTIGTLTN